MAERIPGAGGGGPGSGSGSGSGGSGSNSDSGPGRNRDSGPGPGHDRDHPRRPHGGLPMPASTEGWLLVVIVVICAALGLATDTFLTLVNLFDLLNISAINLIFAAGLLVVLVAGGIDISFAVGASVVQYMTALAVMFLGGGSWVSGIAFAMAFGFLLGAFNAALIHHFRIISIVVTIAAFNVFFGFLMFFTRGVSIYDLPDWWLDRVILYEYETARGDFAEITLPVVATVAVVLATWVLLRRLNVGRQLFALGDNPEGARRIGVNIAAMHYLAYGWLGICAGVAGLMQTHYVQEVVPNALYGRELDVLAAVVLGGARLGGGRGTILGVILGVLLIAITQNGLNLLGILPLRVPDADRGRAPRRDHDDQRLLGSAPRPRRPDAAEPGVSGPGSTGPGSSERGATGPGSGGPGGAAPRGFDLAALLRTGRGEYLGLGVLLVAVLVLFGWTTPRFLSLATFQSITFQMPELGILTLAMLIPILSGGLNLAVTFSANICGLTAAWILQSLGGPEAGVAAFTLALAGALAVGTFIGWTMGIIVAYVGAHPILVSLAFMIFLRGVGEFLTRGATSRAFPRSSGISGTAPHSASPSRSSSSRAARCGGTCSSAAHRSASRHTWWGRTSRRPATPGSTRGAPSPSSTPSPGSCARSRGW